MVTGGGGGTGGHEFRARRAGGGRGGGGARAQGPATFPHPLRRACLTCDGTKTTSF